MKNKLIILAFLIIGSVLASFTFLEKSSTDEHKHNELTFPCHPGGDIYPCSHPLHSIGDLGPCTHYDGFGNPIHWRGDLYPCSHPLHQIGDLGPCTHICW